MTTGPATLLPVTCAICRRRAHGLGYWTGTGRPWLWLCDDADCLALGKTVFHMPDQQFDTFEINARHAGGDAGGKYLDEIGETDLAKLPPENWFEFLNRIILGYGEEMKRQLLEHQAPF